MRRSTLYTLTLLYLWIPVAIFLLTWINPWIGIPCFLLGTWMTLYAYRGVGGQVPFGGWPREVLIVLMILLWVMVNGVGGFWYQTADHMFRNQVFINLVDYEWPIHDGEGHVLCYFWGFWALPAVVAKAAGMYMAGYALQVLWEAAGIWLALRCTFIFINKGVRARVLLVMIVFGGAELLRNMLEIWFEPFGIGWYTYCDDIFFYSYPTTLLAFNFNQMCGAMAATALVLLDSKPGRSAVAVGMLSFSAPFACMALFPVALWQIGRHAFALRNVWKIMGRIFSIWNVGTLAVCFPVLYYLSLTDSRMLPGYLPESWIWYGLVTTLLFGLGLWLPFIWDSVKRYAPFWIMVATVAAAFCLQMSTNPDLRSRIWVPLYMLLIMEVGKEVCRWEWLGAWRRSLLGLALLLGTWPSFSWVCGDWWSGFTEPFVSYRRYLISRTVFTLPVDSFRDHFVGTLPHNQIIVGSLDSSPAIEPAIEQEQ